MRSTRKVPQTRREKSIRENASNIHVLGVVISEGDVIPLLFFEKGQTVTKEVYARVLQT